MKDNEKLAKDMIAKAEKIALFWHMSPDGDCIGGMLGLGRLLEKQGKKISYFVPNKPSKIFDFVKGVKRIKSNFDYKNYDLLVFVDFTSLGRIWTLASSKPEYFKKKPIVVIDHHLDNWSDTDIIIKDVKSVSVCELLFEHTYKWWPKLYDKDIATYFYLGLTSDSGNFLFGVNHIRTFTTALGLLKLGADKNLVVDNLIRKRSLNSIKFLQLLINRIKQKGGLLYTYYDELELKKYAIDQEEAAYGLHIIQNINGPEIVLLIRKKGDSLRWSLRAKEPEWKMHGKWKIDCNKIAQSLWWGGHKLASGFSVPAQGKFEEQVGEVVKHINKEVASSK